MKNYSFLQESYGEYKDIDKDLSSWFRSFKLWWLKTKALVTWFNSCKEYEKESKLINDVVVGLNIKVYAIPDADKNAFVIPGFYVGCVDNFKEMKEKYKKMYPKHSIFSEIKNNFFAILLINQLDQLIKMRKFSYVKDPVRKGKKKIVFKNITTPISIFVTYGMLNAATPEERTAIYLHEIGHWVDAALKIPESIVLHPNEEAVFMASNIANQRMCTRYQELTADKFAKDLGYGNELANALDTLINVRKNVSFYYKIKDWLAKCMIEYQNKGEEFGETEFIDVSQYPSMNTRKKYLKDNK